MSFEQSEAGETKRNFRTKGGMVQLGRNESIPSFHARFKSHCQVMLQVKCDIVFYSLLEKYVVDPKSPTDAESTAAFESVKAMRFIDGAGEELRDRSETKHT